MSEWICFSGCVSCCSGSRCHESGVLRVWRGSGCSSREGARSVNRDQGTAKLHNHCSFDSGFSFLPTHEPPACPHARHAIDRPLCHTLPPLCPASPVTRTLFPLFCCPNQAGNCWHATGESVCPKTAAPVSCTMKPADRSDHNRCQHKTHKTHDLPLLMS